MFSVQYSPYKLKALKEITFHIAIVILVCLNSTNILSSNFYSTNCGTVWIFEV